MLKSFGWRVTKLFFISQSTVDTVCCQLHVVTSQSQSPMISSQPLCTGSCFEGLCLFFGAKKDRNLAAFASKSHPPFFALLLTILYLVCTHLEAANCSNPRLRVGLPFRQVLDDFPTARTGCHSTLPRRLAPQQIRTLGNVSNGMIIMGFWDRTQCLIDARS